MWTRQSTVWQVLVSIQAQILGAKFPYFLEPGVEQQWGTHGGMLAARISTEGGYELLREATLRWAVLDAMQPKHMPAGFEEFVREHFWHKREYIVGLAQEWVRDAARASSWRHMEDLVALHRDVARALVALSGEREPAAAGRLQARVEAFERDELPSLRLLKLSDRE